MAVKLSMTCGLYDRSQPLIDGRVKPRDIDLDIRVNSDDRSRQRDGREGKFDIAEFFTGIYMADLEHRTLGLTAIPIFVKRMFRHSYIYINKHAGIKSPKDLNGKRVGLQTWFTTTALWARGILEDEYGVDLQSITWVANWGEKVGQWQPPPWLKLEIAPQGARLHDLLITGKIDAGITTETWAPFGHPDIDFLLPNYAEEERNYFKKTGFFPIQHTLLIKTAVLEKYPWVAMSMFDAWQEAKQECYRWLDRQRVHMTALWYRSLWEEERSIAGPDPYVWGFKKTRAEVDKMLDYTYRQGSGIAQIPARGYVSSEHSGYVEDRSNELFVFKIECMWGRRSPEDEGKMDFSEFVQTGSGTLAGRYLRMFWQPVCCSYELAVGRALPVRILGEDFTVYRGDSGNPYLVGPRCAHRGTQLSVGSVEGECIRCFYHGWKYAGSGQCVEQPAEGQSFADKVRISGYQVKEYIGLIFAYVGEGEPPPLPRYPRFESADISLDVAGLRRICNYFNNIDNSLDNAHVRFVHQRHRDSVDDHVVLGDPVISVEESEWGIKRYVKYPDGNDLTFFFGMPNINFINGQVVDPVIKRADVIVFKVPVDDDSHIHFEVRAIPLTGDHGRKWVEERREMRAQAEKDRPELVRAILSGKLHLSEVDPNRVDFVMLEDEIAQTGQGVIAVRSNEHLGRSDRGVFLLRKIWERELRNLAEGRPVKRWTYRPDMVPTYPQR